MRQIRCQLAMSLDGFIAGPKGEADWIETDPQIDFSAIYQRYDTLLVGRKTFLTAPSAFRIPGMQTFVLSRTLRQSDHPKVTILADDCEKKIADLRAAKSQKDIWLFGGGKLFRSLLDANLVDAVEVAISPVMLGEGIRLLEPPGMRAKLKLISHKIYRSGIVGLEYAVA